MIMVSVQLLSAIDGRSQELARMEICNMGSGSESLGNYSAETLRGRSSADFTRRTRQRIAYVNAHPRKREHIWNLVAKALRNLRYGGDWQADEHIEISGTPAPIESISKPADNGRLYCELLDLDKPIGDILAAAQAALGPGFHHLRIHPMSGKEMTFQIFAERAS